MLGPEKAEFGMQRVSELGHSGWPEESMVESCGVNLISRGLLWLYVWLIELIKWVRDPY